MRKRRAERDFFLKLKPTSGYGNNKKSFIYDFDKMFNEYHNDCSINDEVKLSIIFYFKHQCYADIDNLLKSLFDALKLKLLGDDSQIKEINAKIIENSFTDGISVIIYSMKH